LVPAYLLSCSDKDLNFNVLVEMVNGEVVTDIESCATKSLPDFSKLSPKEIKLLQAGFKLGRFDEADLARAGQSLDIGNSLNNLVSLGFIMKKDNKYTLSSRFIFSHLSKCACYEKIEYQKVDYSIKLTPKTDIDAVKDSVSRFVNVLDVKECYIVRYDVIFKE
jgi:hypothetical protein